MSQRRRSLGATASWVAPATSGRSVRRGWPGSSPARRPRATSSSGWAPTYVNDRIGPRDAGARPDALRGEGGPLIGELVRSPLDHGDAYERSDTKSASPYLLVVSFTDRELPLT